MTVNEKSWQARGTQGITGPAVGNAGPVACAPGSDHYSDHYGVTVHRPVACAPGSDYSATSVSGSHRAGSAMIAMALSLVVLLASPAFTQTYEVTWSTIDGGGVMDATGGDYRVGGTIGQPDAGRLSGGNYAVTGGFWSMGRSCSVAHALA